MNISIVNLFEVSFQGIIQLQCATGPVLLPGFTRKRKREAKQKLVSGAGSAGHQNPAARLPEEVSR